MTSTASGRAAERDSQRRRVHVDEIGDERRHQPPVVERGAGQARLAMVPRAHAVEEVRHHPCARIGGRTRLRVRRGAVAEGDDDAAFRERPHCREAGIGFGRERHDADEAFVAVAALEEPVEIDRSHQVGRMRTRCATEERALEVYADGNGRAFADCGEPIEHRRVGIQRCSAQGRDTRAAAAVGERLQGHDDVVDGCGREVDRTGPVDLYVDEAGSEDRVVVAVQLCIRRRGAGSDRDDVILFDRDPCR